MNNPSLQESEPVVVLFKRLDPKADDPMRGSRFAAGYDLTAVSVDYDTKTATRCYGTGLAFEIPEGFAGFVFPRSSIFRQGQLLTNCVGVIDSDYRGEVYMRFADRDDCPSEYRLGDRIGQMIVMPVPKVEYVEAAELSETERGTGGYGSTGR